ncbi:hypothetical protein B0H17DRAFT_509260 [Mycena rosella]|uniref:F-box domain-containing protein n=1 Tax=Mycena rosella TaxID=1033263 RepID=A0AAD7GKC5_MYCRO|nr:hypothetical protein B0H17DRAFT_509260 [Mycena rosella]
MIERDSIQTTFSFSESDLAALRQNAVPDPAICAALRESIAAAEDHLSTLPSPDVSPVAAQEDQVIRRYIAIASSRLAPVRRVPPELLSAIFRGVFLSNPPITLGSTSPSPISAVSSHWRAVAVSTPHIWTDFAISILGGQNTLRTLELYLTRSHSVEIVLRIRAPNFTHMNQVNHTIVTKLLQASDRWATADLRLSHRLLPLFSTIRGRISSLKSLSLYVDTEIRRWPAGGGEPQSPATDWDMFELAPRLDRVSLMGVNAIPRLPRDQVQELELAASESVPRLIRIASHFPHLRRLSFGGGFANPSIPSPGDVLHVSTLISCGPVPLQTLQILSTPQLVHLHIRNERMQWKLPPFRDFIARSGCTLTSLTIQSIILHGNDLLEIFPFIRTVEALTFVTLPPNALLDKVMRALTQSTPNSPLLPALKSLKIWGSYLFTNTALIEMLESRTSPTIREMILHRVDLMIGHREFAAADVDRLRALQGVAVTLNLLNGTKPHIRVI